MRDIQQVMERWGAWAADNREDVSGPQLLRVFPGLFRQGFVVAFSAVMMMDSLFLTLWLGYAVNIQ